MSEFRKLAVALIAVSSSPKYVNGSICHEHLLLLSDTIQTHQLPADDTEAESKFDAIKSRVIHDNKADSTTNSSNAYVDEISNEAKMDSDSACSVLKKQESINKTADQSGKPNVYACKEFGTFFKSSCQKFPSLTSVMAEAYGCNDVEFNSARSGTFSGLRKKKFRDPSVLFDIY